jgi:uncharacterized protein involved in exopolysaccharide biosynthesis
MEDEIDLRVYINALIRNWRLIVGLTLVAGVAAFVVSLFIPKTYEAIAYVASVRSSTQIVFDPKFKTTTDATTDTTAANDARRNALVGLVENTSIATQVIGKLGQSLKPEEQNPINLTGAVKGSLVPKSDLIKIAVKADDPQKAAAIANAWVQEYVTQINGLYSEQTGTLESVQAQTRQAKTDYDKAEQALTVFVRQNRVAELSREIAAREKNIQVYRDAQTTGQQAAYTQQLGAQQGLLAAYYAEYNQIELLRGRARVLRSQVSGSSGNRESDALAMLLLKADLTRSVSGTALGGVPGGLVLQLNVTPSNATPSDLVSELDAIIKALEDRQAELKQTIDKLSVTLGNTTEWPVDLPKDDPLVKKITAINAEVLSMRGDLEEESTRQKELAQQRDLAWSTYTTLANKEAELNISAQTQDSQVRLAALASPPVRPVSPSKLKNTAIAAALGLFLGVVAAFAIEYLKQPPVEPAARPAPVPGK